MVKRGRRLYWTLFAVVGIASRALAANFPITAEQVSAATARSGLHATAAQITLPGSIVSTTKTPVLRVESIQRMADHSMAVRMECGDASECLPFYVKIQLGENGEKAAVPNSMGQPHLVETEPRFSQKAPLIRAGEQVTLELDGEHVRICVPVISIENGRLGEKIRVRGATNHQIYRAEVTDPATLKGRF